MGNGALTRKDALGDVFPLALELSVDGGRQVLCPFYFCGSGLRSLIFELL